MAGIPGDASAGPQALNTSANKSISGHLKKEWVAVQKSANNPEKDKNVLTTKFRRICVEFRGIDSHRCSLVAYLKVR